MPWWRRGEVSEAIAAVTGEWDDAGQSARRDELHGEEWHDEEPSVGWRGWSQCWHRRPD
jgi:hypothetical protein